MSRLQASLAPLAAVHRTSVPGFHVWVVVNSGRHVQSIGSRICLGHVLCDGPDESFVAADGCGETEEGQVVARMAFVAVVEAAVAGQPGHRPLDAFARDPDSDALVPESSPQVRDVVRLVGMQASGLETTAVVGVMSRLVPHDHGLQRKAAVDVGGRQTDDEGQSVRIRQDAHLGTRPASVHGARTCVFAPLFFSPDVGRVEHGAGEVEQVCVVEQVQDLLVQPSTGACSRPDQEPAVGRRLRYAEAWRQGPPGASADQDEDDGRKHRLVRRVPRSAALRPHPDGGSTACRSRTARPERSNSIYPALWATQRAHTT